MDSLFPFFARWPEADGPGIYHSHPRCRIAQGITEESRVPGTGEGRQECPFCYLLGQFQASRAMRGHPSLEGGNEGNRNTTSSSQDAVLS